MADLDYIILLKKEITDGNRKFPVFYGYHQVLNKEGNDYEDVLVPAKDKDGKPIMKARNFKVVLRDKVKELLLKDDKFPYRLSLEKGLDYFITIDKDTNKQPRLDKYGKRHAVVVIESFNDFNSVRTSMTFDDIDNIE